MLLSYMVTFVEIIVSREVTTRNRNLFEAELSLKFLIFKINLKKKVKLYRKIMLFLLPIGLVLSTLTRPFIFKWSKEANTTPLLQFARPRTAAVFSLMWVIYVSNIRQAMTLYLEYSCPPFLCINYFSTIIRFWFIITRILLLIRLRLSLFHFLACCTG